MSTIAETVPVSKLTLWLARVLSAVLALCLRTSNPLLIEMMFGFYLDLLLSGGPWLRDRNLRALIPVRR